MVKMKVRCTVVGIRRQSTPRIRLILSINPYLPISSSVISSSSPFFSLCALTDRAVEDGGSSNSFGEMNDSSVLLASLLYPSLLCLQL